MENKPKIDADLIHLFHLEIREFNINTQAFKNTADHKLNIAHRLMHNLEDKRLKLDLICSFRNHSEEQLLQLDMDYHFHIENLEDFYTINEKGMPKFSATIIATLLGIALSTTRGILFEKLANQGIHNIIIPVVSPMKMLANNL